ncbi:MAG: MFS transporter, partial [bacterium]
AMPAAALAAGRLGARADGRARAAAGVILLAGGLAGLALLPSATIAATIVPQILVGVGLALTLAALTESALEGRAPQAIHGGWTIAARHAGVVAGLLVLTPVFTADLEAERADAEQAGTAALLDSRLDPSSKIDLAERLADRLAEEGERVPVLSPAFEPLPSDPGQRARTVELRSTLDDELDRAATHAFSASFGIAAAFALAALIPVALARGRPRL